MNTKKDRDYVRLSLYKYLISDKPRLIEFVLGVKHLVYLLTFIFMSCLFGYNYRMISMYNINPEYYDTNTLYKIQLLLLFVLIIVCLYMIRDGEFMYYFIIRLIQFTVNNTDTFGLESGEKINILDVYNSSLNRRYSKKVNRLAGLLQFVFVVFAIILARYIWKCSNDSASYTVMTLGLLEFVWFLFVFVNKSTTLKSTLNVLIGQ